MLFALLTRTSFQLFDEMHMSKPPLFDLPYSQLSFVDLGMAVEQREKEQKYYFIKVVNETSQNSGTKQVGEETVN
jgi:hypothetical protein